MMRIGAADERRTIERLSPCEVQPHWPKVFTLFGTEPWGKYLSSADSST